MENFLLTGMALVATLSGAESLQRQIEEKDIEIRRLRQRIEVLEQRAVGSHPVIAEPGEPDASRALERALVRESGLLLPRGAREFETNFVYSHFNDRTVGFRRDAFGPGVTFRIGFPGHYQLEAELPYVFESRREGELSTRSSGVGDLALVIAHQLIHEHGSVPNMIGTVRFQAATGDNTVFESATPVAHGSGFDSIQASLTAVKRSDPLVFFGTYTFTQNLAETKGAFEVDPGNAHGLRFGTLLAASPQTSMRVVFDLVFPDDTRINGLEAPDTGDPLATLELGSSALLSRSTALDVSVEAGLTSNAPDYRISVALPVRF